MTNPFAADPDSPPQHRMLAEEDVRKAAFRQMRIGIGAVAMGLIGVILWMSLIDIVKVPVVNLAYPVFGPGIERVVVLFLMFLSPGIMIVLPTLAVWCSGTIHALGCPACGANHPTQSGWILMHRICPICREEIVVLGSESEEEYRVRQKKWGSAEAGIPLAWLALTLPTMDAAQMLISPAWIEQSPRSLLLLALFSVIMSTACWLLSRNRRVALPFVLSLAFLAMGIGIFLRL